MSPKTLLTTLLIVLVSISAYSQNRINGQVIAAANKQPLADVSVSVLGKNIGTVTNDEGKFSLVAPLTNSDTLAISCIGYKPQNIAFASIGTNLVVQLDTLMQQLTEVKIKPLTLKQLIDSIAMHNQSAFLNPMKLNGYYREFVFTNNKCTEYADALTSFYRGPNKSSFDAQLKIIASRCAEAKADNKEKGSVKEYYVESVIPPNKLFEYAVLNGMLNKFLPDGDLKDYSYDMASTDNDELIITIMPKLAGKKFRKVTFNLSADFGLTSYKIEVDPSHKNNLPERSLLGIHVQLLSQYLEVKYSRVNNKIYPQFFKYESTMHIGGKFLGTPLDQTYNPRSEYVTTDLSPDLNPFIRSELYKKGNLCDNGVAINDALLRSHNFITQSRKDSLAIGQIK